MQSNEEALVQTLNPYFSADKRRIKFLAMLIVALLKLTDSSLAQWALAINQPTQRGARFRRAQRFLMQFRFSARLYAQVAWQRYGQANEVVLTLDRTQYRQGSHWVQFLVLGIAHQQMSIPLLWQRSGVPVGQPGRKLHGRRPPDHPSEPDPVDQAWARPAHLFDSRPRICWLRIPGWIADRMGVDSHHSYSGQCLDNPPRPSPTSGQAV